MNQVASRMSFSLPKLVVFDLDFTLWDCGGTWCDCLTPPFSLIDGETRDRGGRRIVLYPDVTQILDWCDEHQLPMALASRTEQPAWAKELLVRLKISHRFKQAEIYPSSKLRHFAAIRDAMKLDDADMIFFDDEMRNIREVGDAGIRSVLVRNGLSLSLFHAALDRHSRCAVESNEG
ncbi:MAG: magnesium-dependent phosphatase-1 [Planctomycetota bacterium]